MTGYFIYSVLQFKYSLAIGESLNVGILFYFPDDNILEFVSNNVKRVKAIYPDFDISLFNGFIKVIKSNIIKHVALFNEKYDGSDFAKYIHQYILAEDAASWIFNEPKHIKDVFGDRTNTVDEFSKLLIPGIGNEKTNPYKRLPKISNQKI